MSRRKTCTKDDSENARASGWGEAAALKTVSKESAEDVQTGTAETEALSQDKSFIAAVNRRATQNQIFSKLYKDTSLTAALTICLKAYPDTDLKHITGCRVPWLTAAAKMASLLQSRQDPLTTA